jgi:O-antigen ligase
VSSTFPNRNSYATYAIFGVVANLAIYLHLASSGMSQDPHRGRAIRNFLERFFSGGWLFGIGFLLCLAAVVLTQSRAGVAAAIIALVTFMSVYRRGGGMNILLILTVLAIFGFVAATLTTGLTERLLATDSEEIRFIVYPAVVEGIMARPYLGHGLGAFQDTFREFVPISVANFDWDLAHNSFLENAFELGIPAAAAFYLALAWITLVILRGCLIRRRHRSFSCVAIACIAAAAFHSVFDFSLQMPATAALFAIILGIGWAQSFRRLSQEPR